MADEEHLKKLIQGVDAWNKWREESPGVLSFADLVGADLANADLRRAKLADAQLESAILPDAELVDADLRRANLADANLTGADLRRAKLADANLTGADLKRANLESADLEGANLEGARLQGGKLVGAKLTGADLTGADLTGADLKGVNLEGAKLESAKLNGANLNDVNLIDARLGHADLTGANLRLACLGQAKLVRVDLVRADLTGAKLWRADLEGANLKGANLRRADLKGAKLAGADLKGAILVDADLMGADIESADLEGAKLEDAKLVDADCRRILTDKEREDRLGRWVAGSMLLAVVVSVVDAWIKHLARITDADDWKASVLMFAYILILTTFFAIANRQGRTPLRLIRTCCFFVLFNLSVFMFLLFLSHNVYDVGPWGGTKISASASPPGVGARRQFWDLAYAIMGVGSLLVIVPMIQDLMKFLRDREERLRCYHCGTVADSFFCDHPVGEGTCNRRICQRCATETGPDRHLCPEHASQVELPKER